MNDITSSKMGVQSEEIRSPGKPRPLVVRMLARFTYRLIQVLLVVLWLWTIGAIYYLPWIARWLTASLACVYLLVTPWLLARSDKRWETMRIPLVVSLVMLLLQSMIDPSNDRPWSADQAVLPRVQVEGQQAVIRNVRDFVYRDLHDFDVRYADRTFDLNQIDSIWFCVEEFSSLQALAHTFLTFGFRDGEKYDYVSCSVEIRKEKGEQFSAISAMFKQFELMYVVGEERDLLGLRAIHRRDVVYLYPMRASKKQQQQLFLDVTQRINELADQPEFYHTLASNCTNNLVYHLNRLTPGAVDPLSLGIVFPGYSDRLAFHLGLIDTNEGFAETRRRYRVDQLARELADEPDFSRQLRQRMGKQ